MQKSEKGYPTDDRVDEEGPDAFDLLILVILGATFSVNRSLEELKIYNSLYIYILLYISTLLKKI